MLLKFLRGVKHIVRLLVGILYDLWIGLGDRIQIARGLHREILQSTVVGDKKTKNFARTAIVAIYPSSESLPFLSNLLGALRRSNFAILVVSTKRLNPRIAASILESCDGLIERRPIGRDFGSYQLAIRMLQEWGIYDSIDELALINDSMFYPEAFSATLTELLTDGAEWLALFENFLLHYHSQSFFQIFRRPIIQSDKFLDYRRRYVPFSTRTHSINQGEVGLSQCLRNAGCFPSTFYTSRKVIAKVDAEYRAGQRLDQLSILMVLTLGEKYYDILSKMKLALPDGAEEDYRSQFVSAITSELAILIERRNPTHSVGMLVNFLFNAPIKRDLVYRGTVTAGELLRVASGFSDEERLCIERDLRIRGNPSTLRGIKRMLYFTGRL